MLGIEAQGLEPGASVSDTVSDDLPVRSIDVLADLVAPGDRAFKQLLVPRTTLGRRRKSASQRLTSRESDRLARVATAFGFALEIYKDLPRAREFMSCSHPMLDGERPMEMALATAAGAEAVMHLLGRMAYGGGV